MTNGISNSNFFANFKSMESKEWDSHVNSVISSIEQSENFEVWFSVTGNDSYDHSFIISTDNGWYHFKSHNLLYFRNQYLKDLLNDSWMNNFLLNKEDYNRIITIIEDRLGNTIDILSANSVRYVTEPPFNLS